MRILLKIIKVPYSAYRQQTTTSSFSSVYPTPSLKHLCSQNLFFLHRGLLTQNLRKNSVFPVSQVKPLFPIFGVASLEHCTQSPAASTSVTSSVTSSSTSASSSSVSPRISSSSISSRTSSSSSASSISSSSSSSSSISCSSSSSSIS